jgi:hypothetical protein
MPTSGTLLSNVTVTTPRVSPAVQLSATGGVWTATLDTTAHAGSSCVFTIQDGPSNNGPWTDVSDNVLTGADGLSHLGWDQSHQVEDFKLYGAGPWWRINVTAVTGSVLINTLTVQNA